VVLQCGVSNIKEGKTMDEVQLGKCRDKMELAQIQAELRQSARDIRVVAHGSENSTWRAYLLNKAKEINQFAELIGEYIYSKK